MVLTQDIEIDGAPYSVVPGSYKRKSEPLAIKANEVKRLRLYPGGRGNYRAIDDTAAERSPGWNSVGVAPVFDGQGVEPFGAATAFGDASFVDVATATQRITGAGGNGQGLIGSGRRVYKPAPYGAAWTPFFSVDLGAGLVVNGVVYYQGGMLLLCGQTADVRRFNMATNAVSVWRTGEKATYGVPYADQLVYAPGALGNEAEIRMSGVRWNGAAVTHFRYVDAPVRNMALFNGKVAIATRSSLYFLGGRPYPGEPDDASVPADTSKAPEWIGELEPVMSHGLWAADDDFQFLVSYRGRLYTWLQGRVAEFDDSTEQGRWLRQGPEGAVCYGGCVAGDHLFVSLVSRYGGRRELWMFDGGGWWCLESLGSSNTERMWPVPLFGTDNRDLIVFRAGSTTYDLWRTRYRSAAPSTYAAGGEWTSALLDAGDPTRSKLWRKVGAEFAAPADRGNSASGDAVSVALEYSTDGGVTWLQAAATATSAAGQRLRSLESSWPASVQATYLQLRVRWSSVSDWAPVLTSVWAEYTLGVEAEAKRRRWELTIDASDRKMRRDGGVAASSGRQDVQALWADWAAGAPVTFRDVDYDSDPIDYAVRIETIEERVGKPGDQARWGESVIALTLVQV